MNATRCAPLTPAVLASMARYVRSHVTADVENCEQVTVPGEGGTLWLDISPLVDPREHCPQVIDMASEALALGFALRVLHAHPRFAHLVRVVPDEAGAS
jgi:hypothetical protein